MTENTEKLEKKNHFEIERQFELGREVKPRENDGTLFLLVKHIFIIHQTVSLAQGWM